MGMGTGKNAEKFNDNLRLDGVSRRETRIPTMSPCWMVLNGMVQVSRHEPNVRLMK